MSTIIAIGAVIFVLYLIFRIAFIRNEPVVQELEISTLTKLISSSPNNPDLYFKRGFKYLQRASNHLVLKENDSMEDCYSNAESDFYQVTKLNPKHADAYYYIGMIKWVRREEFETFENMKIAAELGSKTAADFLKQNH